MIRGVNECRRKEVMRKEGVSTDRSSNTQLYRKKSRFQKFI